MPAYTHRPPAKIRVILIDRNAASNAALEQILSEESETYVMPDVVSALDWASLWPPELILLGRSIIATEGAGAVARFKKQVPGVSILIVCDTLDDDEIRQARMQGVVSTLLRPLKRDVVNSTVQELLASRPLQRLAMA